MPPPHGLQAWAWLMRIAALWPFEIAEVLSSNLISYLGIYSPLNFGLNEPI